MRTLLLTPWMAPSKIVSWERGVVLVLLGKVDVVEEHDEEIRSQSVSLRAPSIVRLRKGRTARPNLVRFNRINVFTRDDFRCQYCGERGSAGDLTFDHVIPRARGGKTSWENIVAACRACNGRKGSRTPEEAGLELRKKPVVPKRLSVVSPFVARLSEMPSAWRPYCAASRRTTEDVA